MSHVSLRTRSMKKTFFKLPSFIQDVAAFAHITPPGTLSRFYFAVAANSSSVRVFMHGKVMLSVGSWKVIFSYNHSWKHTGCASYYVFAQWTVKSATKQNIQHVKRNPSEEGSDCRSVKQCVLCKKCWECLFTSTVLPFWRFFYHWMLGKNRFCFVWIRPSRACGWTKHWLLWYAKDFFLLHSNVACDSISVW